MCVHHACLTLCMLSPRLMLWRRACSFVHACVDVKATDSIVLIYATLEGTGLDRFNIEGRRLNILENLRCEFDSCIVFTRRVLLLLKMGTGSNCS